jgi:dGTPase
MASELKIRERLELWESEKLAPQAARSHESRGRGRAEAEDPQRTVFQRDRDRVIHAKSFRRLMHKTQVFLAPASEHYRTRLTHTLEVAQIARSIARALCLNEDLAEAISLAHDLGHTPFGHAGEEVLNRKLKNGFRHSEQSLRVVDLLEKDGQGLNLTFEVRNGIMCHSKSKRGVMAEPELFRPATLEAQVVRLADSIAYINHDIQDAIRGGFLSAQSLPPEAVKRLGKTSSERINTMVRDIISASAELSAIRMSPAVLEATENLRLFLFKEVYDSEKLKVEFAKAARLLEGLYTYFKEHPDLIQELAPHLPAGDPERRLCDFISGMTDRYALDLYAQLMLPHPWEGRG